MGSDRRTAYGRIEGLFASGECVVLDGGVGSEIVRGELAVDRHQSTPETWAIYDRGDRVLDVHRQYALAGCDVISTHTWGILSTTSTDRGRRPGRTGLPAWTVATRDAVTLARRGIAEAGATGRCAVAFSLNDADPLLAGEQLLLGLLWSVDPPDLVLVETLATLPSPALLQAIAEVAAGGMPVWVSFRRASTPPGVLAELEQAGVRSVLVNCIPPAETSQALAELAASTSLPVGCYPRLDEDLDPVAYGALATEWRATGARIIGGCCGVGPAHVRAVRDQLTPPTGTMAAQAQADAHAH